MSRFEGKLSIFGNIIEKSPQGGFFGGNLGWKIQPGILTGGVLAGRIQPGIPANPSCGDLVVWEERFLEKGGNLLRQARPPGLRAFPGLNGTLCACPQGI